MSDLQFSSSQPWYAVYCKPLKERQAAVALEAYLGLTVYLPELRRRFHGQIRRASFFPRYLFVQADLAIVKLSDINTTPGVLRLLAFDEAALPIPAAVIETIREQVEGLNARGGVPTYDFHPGDTVRLKDGSLHGMEAVFMGPMEPRERVQVLIHFLGQLREAEVAVDILEPTSAGPIPSRERRTRGKGRKIKRLQWNA
jgi:transcription antitermination factor NusG